MFILRVLSGPLFGVEVVLPEQDCFIKTVNLSSTPMSEEPGGMTRDVFLSLPVVGEAPNFRLKQQFGPGGEISLVAECYEGNRVSIREIPLNQPVEFGAARIAVRDEEENWSEAVEQVIVLPSPARQGGARWPRPLKVASACLLGVGAVVLATWVLSSFWLGSSHETVSSLLTGVPCQVIAKDGHTYVVAEDGAARAWAHRLLVANGIVNKVELRSRAADTEKAELRLEQDGIAFFKVDLTDASRPIILLRAEGKPPTEQSMVDATRRVKEALPYAVTVVPVYRYVQEARAAALEVAAQLGTPVESRETGDHLVVSIEGVLDDTQLSVLSQGLTRLHATWGHRYVNFIVKQTDMTNTQGLKSGVAGYRVLSGHHVVFSSVNADNLHY